MKLTDQQNQSNYQSSLLWDLCGFYKSYLSTCLGNTFNCNILAKELVAQVAPWPPSRPLEISGLNLFFVTKKKKE